MGRENYDATDWVRFGSSVLLCYTLRKYREKMKIAEHIPGFAIVLFIAVVSFFLSTFHASFDALVISIIVGLLLGNVIGNRSYYERGVESALKFFLPLGIALYGSQLVLAELQWGQLLSIILVFSGLFGLTLLIANIFNIDKRVAVLLASGLSVCGASAIAVISPLIGARREDTSISVISVMMLGLTGMIFYPILNDFLSLTHNEFNFLAGTTLPMLGQVKVAALNVCPECSSAAVDIKLIRISFLFFLVTTSIFFSGAREKKVKIPWFVIAFILLAVGVNVSAALAPAGLYFRWASSFFLCAALAAIGFSVDLDSVMENGILPLGVIFFSWSLVILTMYLVRNLL
jgi:uncharacterized integral membrane protein (TIGR00698 family)